MNKWKTNAADVLVNKYNIPRDKAGVWVSKYYIACYDALRLGYKLSDKIQIAAGHIPINLEVLRSKLRTQHKGKKVDLIADLDLITIIELGSNHKGRYTMAATKIPLNILLADEDSEEVFKHWYGEYLDILNDTSKYDSVTIDLESITAYIKNTKAFITKQQKKGYNTDKLQNYMYKAQSLKIVQELLGFVPQIINESDYGRLYYKGLNLVNCPTVVREAALGKCVKVDICNSVFQWRYNVVKGLYPDVKLPETLDYTEFKVNHRDRLVQDAFGESSKLDYNYKKGLIKQALAAIGFGAKAVDTSFWGAPALRDVFTPLGSKVVQTDVLDRFLADPFIQRFVAEQEMMSKLIFDSVKDTIKADPELYELLKNKRGIAKSKVLAYLYQHAERETMQPVYDLLGDKVQLKVHDGFYATNLTEEDLKEVKLHFLSANVTIDIDNIKKYFHINYEAQQEEYNHKLRMDEQAANARGYNTSKYTTDLSTVEPVEPNEIDKLMEQSKVRDASAHEGNTDGSGYNGEGYNGTGYNTELDPFLMEMNNERTN